MSHDIEDQLRQYYQDTATTVAGDPSLVSNAVHTGTARRRRHRGAAVGSAAVGAAVAASLGLVFAVPAVQSARGPDQRVSSAGGAKTMNVEQAVCGQSEREFAAGSVPMLSARLPELASAGPSIVGVKPTLTNVTSKPLTGITGSVSLVVVSLDGHVVATSPGSRAYGLAIDLAPGEKTTLPGSLSLLDCRKAMPPLVTDKKVVQPPRATLSAGRYRVYGSVEIVDAAAGVRRLASGGPWTLVLS
jgi:hypothetical protein